MFVWIKRIANELDYELVMVTNQDGLGTATYPEEIFWPIQNFILKTLENEGVIFSNIHIDKTYASENARTRKPDTGMLMQYLNNPEYDIEGSFVIGDRVTDVQLAKNLGCNAIWINNDVSLGAAEITKDHSPDFLVHPSKLNIKPGAEIKIIEKSGFDQAMKVVIDSKHEAILGKAVSQLILMKKN